MIETLSEGRVRRVTLNRPEKRNALNSALCGALAQAFEDAERDDAIGAILLSAKGPVFCAGMDLEEALHADPGELNRLHETVFTQIDRLRKPVVVAVEGAALGVGLGLVANAHIAVASPESRFGLTEIRVGLWPVLIMRSIVLATGERRATELSLTGRIFGAGEATQYGFVTEIAENALELAAAIAHAVSRHSPLAIAEGLNYTRSMRNSGAGSDWESAGVTGMQVRERLLASSAFKVAASVFLTGQK